MKITNDLEKRSVTIRFDSSFGVRDAIGLPALIGSLPKAAFVTLDFTDVKWMRDSALAVLIPALGSLRRPPVVVIGLDDAADELGSVAYVPA